MPQVDIVRVGDEYLREYRVESGDNLSSICSRYGHTDWRKVYDHVANAPFRDHFPNPHLIQPDAVPLYLPLPGAMSSGRRVRGRPIEHYLAVQVVDLHGLPLKECPLILTTPGATNGTQVVTTLDGDIVRSNPAAGDYALSSSEFMLLEEDPGSNVIDPIDITSMPRRGPLLEPATPTRVRRDETMTVVGRHMALILCPICGRTFRVVENLASSSCPNDGFSLGYILAEVFTNPSSFDGPDTPHRKKPREAPTSVLCRGSSAKEATTMGVMAVRWDESRFAHSDGDDLTLWAKRNDGKELRMPIVGRRTWARMAPELNLSDDDSSERVYEFHEVELHATSSYPYDAIRIHSNETVQLNEALRWITVHHSAGDPREEPREGPDAVRFIQEFHVTKGIDGRRAADIGYHFIIDRAGCVFEGRPLGIKGSHVRKFNGGNVGVLLLGNFETSIDENPLQIYERPSDVALAALDLLVEILALRFAIGSVASHRVRERQNKVSSLKPTACPGDLLRPHVRDKLRSRYPGSGEPVVRDD